MIVFLVISKFSDWPWETLQTLGRNNSPEVIQRAVVQFNNSFWTLLKQNRKPFHWSYKFIILLCVELVWVVFKKTLTGEKDTKEFCVCRQENKQLQDNQDVLLICMTG